MTTRGHPDCERWRRLLPAYGDDELAAVDRAALAAHLADCTACRDTAEREAQFGHWLHRRVGGTVSPPAALVERVASVSAGGRAPARPAWVRVLASEWTPRIAMAAMLAFLVALPLLWWPQRAPAF